MRVSAAGTCTGAQSCLGVKLVGVAIQGPPNTAQTESTLAPPPPPTASPGVPRTAYTTAEAELYASRKLTTHSRPTVSPAPSIPAATGTDVSCVGTPLARRTVAVRVPASKDTISASSSWPGIRAPPSQAQFHNGTAAASS